MKVAINGFGRIGRNFFRAAKKNNAGFDMAWQKYSIFMFANRIAAFCWRILSRSKQVEESGSLIVPHCVVVPNGAFCYVVSMTFSRVSSFFHM